jgi:ribosomal protein S18 acetylase RimI-like enzyme
MESSQHQVVIRPFQTQDADACFRIRSDAFVQVFYDLLGPEVTAAGVNAYMPHDFASMAQNLPTFVATLQDEPVGFLMLRIHDLRTAELFLLYIRLAHLRRSIGTQLVRHTESWLHVQYPKMLEIFVDTIVPGYNAGFYERLGYATVGEHLYRLSGKSVRAIRLRKRMKRDQ